MKKLLLLLLLLPSVALAESPACTQRLLLLSNDDQTTAEVGDYVAVPPNIGRYYIKYGVTEDVAGAITITVNMNEDKSATNEVVIDTQAALAATGVTRVLDSGVSGQDELGPYLQVDTSTVSGTWDYTVELWYSQTPVK